MDTKEYKAKRLYDFTGEEISRSTYNLIIGMTLCWGIFIDIIIARFFKEQILSLHPLAICLIYLLGSLGCIFIIYNNSNPVISFLGFTGLSAFMGLLLTFFISFYEAGDIFLAFIVTGAITTFMTILSTIKPQWFTGLGTVLFTVLLVVLIAEITLLLLGFSLTITDWIVCLIFCGYIGYDWSKAQMYPSSTDNAIDSAADIYVDIINIFVRILSIIGKKSD